MKKLVKPLIALSTLSLALACAPAFKGEGINKPNLAKQEQQQLEAQRQAKLVEDGTHASDVQSTAHVVSVVRRKQTKDGYHFTIGIDNADDLAKPEREFGMNVSLVDSDASIAKVERSGKINLYRLEAKCLNGCENIAVVLTKIPRANMDVGSKSASFDSTAQAASFDTASQSASFQSGPTVVPANSSMTGVAANKDGQILSQMRFDLGTELNEAISALEKDLAEHNRLNMATK